MRLYLWSELVNDGDIGEDAETTTYTIRQPCWAASQKDAENSATESIREELDEGADSDEVADAFIFSIDFEPNEATLVAMLNAAHFTSGKSMLAEDDTAIEILPVKIIIADEVEPSPDDDDSADDAEEEDEFHIPKED